MRFLGYSVGKSVTEAARRESLHKAVITDLRVREGAPNKRFIDRYAKPGTEVRKRAILARLEELLRGMWWVKNDPVKHHKKLPEYQRREADIKWFREAYLG